VQFSCFATKCLIWIGKYYVLDLDDINIYCWWLLWWGGLFISCFMCRRLYAKKKKIKQDIDRFFDAPKKWPN
jgi:hypothetical protein